MPEDTERENAAGEAAGEDKGGEPGDKAAGGGQGGGGCGGWGEAAASGGAGAQGGPGAGDAPAGAKDPAGGGAARAADPAPAAASHGEGRGGGGGGAARPGGAAAAAKEPKRYTFFVGPGNNSELVRATLERRPWWVLGKEDDPELNLKWLQVRNRTVAEYVRRMGSKQFLNHLEGLTCIGRKNELYANLKGYCDRERLNVHEIAPPTFIITVGENCAEYFEFSRVCKQLESRSNNRFAPVRAAKNAISAVSAMQAAVKASKGDAPEGAGAGGISVNPPPDDAAPAPSATDAESVASAASTAEHAALASAPPTAHATPAPSEAPSEAGGEQPAPASPAKSPTKAGTARALLKGGKEAVVASKAGRMSRADAISSTTTAGDRNIWIVKPTNNNRGNGIRVFKSFSQIDEHLKKKNQGAAVIVQKYIERPLLYKRRKFDVRVLVLVDPQMQVYVYKDAYCRTSTQEYSLDNINDLFIHLTNYAVQKKNKKGDKGKQLDEDELDEDETMEEGNNLSMDELSVFLKELDPNGPDANDVMDKIKKIVVTVFNAVWRKLNPQRERNTFEVFGWDFLLDEELNTWLIEVNTNPYIGCSSSLLRTIFTGMLEGLARKCIDPYFPPPPGMKGVQLPEVEGADLWEKVLPEKDATKR